MGGDESIVYAATGGVGLKAVKPECGVLNFFHYLRQNGIINPFKFVQAKFHLEMPISSALFWVYFERFKINEYSGRYSIMMDQSRSVTADELERIIDEPDEQKRMSKAAEAAKKISEIQQKNRKWYELLLDKNLARELARIGLGLDNQTKFYLSANLEELAQATKIALLTSKSNPDLKEFAEAIEDVCKRLAPLACEALCRPINSSQELEVCYDAFEEEPNKNPRYGISTTKRLTIPTAEELLFVPQQYLNKGWFMPTDYMGGDASVVQSARVSYGAGTRKTSEDNQLIRYLLRHKHTTPFEHVSLQAESKTPIFVRPRQAGRHRTFDKEGVLGQWLPLADWYEISDSELKEQSKSNRQGRGCELEEKVKEEIKSVLKEQFTMQNKVTQELKSLGVPWWLAMQIKGVGHYTRGSEKVDLHNIFHFLKLRDDPHAQKEIQLYAKHWSKFVEAVAPVAYGAFLDYEKNAILLTKPEQELLRGVIEKVPYKTFETLLLAKGWSKKDGKLNREAEELLEKVKRLGWLKE